MKQLLACLLLVLSFLAGGVDAQTTAIGRARNQAIEDQIARREAKRPAIMTAVAVPDLDSHNAAVILDAVHSGKSAIKLKTPPQLKDVGTYDYLVTVIQVLDRSTFIGRSGFGVPGGRVCWFEGWDTRGLVDNDKVLLEGLLTVADTTQYQTALGSQSTVFVIRPIDMEKLESASREWRDWTSADGNHTTHAAIVDFERGQVSLVIKDGKEISVALSSLSNDDRTYVRKWVAAKREAQRKR